MKIISMFSLKVKRKIKGSKKVPTKAEMLNNRSKKEKSQVPKHWENSQVIVNSGFLPSSEVKVNKLPYSEYLLDLSKTNFAETSAKNEAGHQFKFIKYLHF